jgi:hypothetical protein
MWWGAPDNSTKIDLPNGRARYARIIHCQGWATSFSIHLPRPSVYVYSAATVPQTNNFVYEIDTDAVNIQIIILMSILSLATICFTQIYVYFDKT